MDVATATLLSPVVLFFILGLIAALLRSQMSIPEAFAKGIAIYLMMAIGLKGGFEMSKSSLNLEIGLVFLAAIGLSFALPVIAFFLLRFASGMDRINAAATAAHYGSISIVTFVAATEVVELSGFSTSGHMVAVAALMETPAIVSALFLARSTGSGSVFSSDTGQGDLLQEVVLNASVVVLTGSLLIGWLVGAEGAEKVAPFFVTPFQGILCLFMLDMGLSAGRGLRHGWRQLNVPTILFGLYMPFISAFSALLLALATGMSTGDTILLMTLAASASYIAVPAAMRLVLPEAKPSIYLTLSLGITFPFNIVIGVPVYIAIARFAFGS